MPAIISLHQAAAQEALQHNVRQTIQKVYASTVQLSNYDSVRQRQLGGPFSGVVVTGDGYILTAAHACWPGKVYKVQFPDGKEYIGTGLGRIDSLDVAVMKITAAGEYPHSEMGFSSALKKGQPCISISHPASLERELQPVVRFGYIGQPMARNGMVRSTCLMEPGDSGGPLFDLLGRVIGIHSRIDLSLNSNFEVAVDHFREYWPALIIAKDYKPEDLAEPDKTGADPLAAQIAMYDDVSFTALENKLDDVCFTVNSTVKDTAQQALATLIALPGKEKNDRYFISKSSLVGNDVMIAERKAEVVARDEKNDLVMLKVSGAKHTELRGGVEINAVAVDTVNASGLGEFLISPDPRNEGEISVVGSQQFDMKARYSAGFLGVMTEDYTGGVRLRNVNFNTPASKAQLRRGDIILSINGNGFDGMQQFSNALSAYRPGEKVMLTTQRNDSTYTVSVELGTRPDMGTHIADHFEDGKSKRRDGFQHIFVHDARLKPAECGGPVFDLDGRFRGINIARFSRTSSVAIAPAEVKAFVEGNLPK